MNASMVCGVRRCVAAVSTEHWLGVTLAGCNVGQWRAAGRARVRSLSPLNEMLVSEVHVGSFVVQKDVNALVFCRNLRAGPAALIVSSPSQRKFAVCCRSCLFNPALGYKSC